jgi:hypothetical protein
VFGLKDQQPFNVTNVGQQSQDNEYDASPEKEAPDQHNALLSIFMTSKKEEADIKI